MRNIFGAAEEGGGLCIRAYDRSSVWIDGAMAVEPKAAVQRAGRGETGSSAPSGRGPSDARGRPPRRRPRRESASWDATRRCQVFAHVAVGTWVREGGGQGLGPFGRPSGVREQTVSKVTSLPSKIPLNVALQEYS